MNTTLTVLVGIFMIGFLWVAYQREQLRHEIQHITRLLDFQNPYIDYVFRKFSLNIRDPYVIRPGFDDKRCYHCFYPVEHGHHTDCAWARVQPLAERLYGASGRPQNAPAQTSAVAPLAHKHALMPRRGGRRKG